MPSTHLHFVLAVNQLVMCYGKKKKANTVCLIENFNHYSCKKSFKIKFAAFSMSKKKNC